jgi:perosamine synthetase
MGTNESFVPLSVPRLGGNEWAYVKECLDTNWVSSVGPFVDRFERMVADALEVPFAVATANGTSALHIALQLAGVEPGDEVVVSDLTFIAPANAIRYLGAWPTFVDAEPVHWQMDPEKLKHFLRKDCVESGRGLRNRHTGRRVAAIMPVHVLGHSCDLAPILDEAAHFGIPIVEDASESLGVRYRDKPAGSFGLLSCLSFNGNKIVTTGGGGMILTRDASLAKRARYLTTQAKDDSVEFIHNEVGYNYRLTNVLAAIGCAQMERLDDVVAEKRRTAAAYTEAFETSLGLVCPAEPEGTFSTFWLYTVLLREGCMQTDSRALLRHLDGMGIQTRPLWQPMHLSPAHRGAFATDCSVSERLNRWALSLPCTAGITRADRDRVVSAVRGFLDGSPSGGHGVGRDG